MNNMERLPADTFFLDLELRQEVERMASLGYAPDDIASYLGLDAESFVFDAGREGTTVYSLLSRGLGDVYKRQPCIPLCAGEH